MFTKFFFYYLIYTFVFIFLDSITFNTMHPTFINIFITFIFLISIIINTMHMTSINKFIAFIFFIKITSNTMHSTSVNIFITQIISIHFINFWDLFFNEIYKFIFMFFFIIKNIYLINPLI